MPGKVEASTIFLDQEWWIPGIRPKQILNQKFATVLSDEDFSSYDCRSVDGFPSRPRMPASMKASGVSEWKIVDDEFQISIELDEFEVEDLKVTKMNGYVEVHGKHEEKKDQHGLVSREFCRRFRLPDDSVIDAVKSSYSNFKLTITAPIIRGTQVEYKGPRELPVRERDFYPCRTEMDVEEFGDLREMCHDIYDKLLDTDRMKAELAEVDSETVNLEEFTQRWSKKRQTEQDKMDLETRDHLKTLDNMVQEAFNMFRVHTESPGVPADPAVAAMPPKSPVVPAVAAEPPTSPVVPAVAAEPPTSPVVPAVAAEPPTSPVVPAVATEPPTSPVVPAVATEPPTSPVVPAVVENGK